MKTIKTLGIILAIAGVALMAIGIAAMIAPSVLSVSGAHVVAVGIAVTMLGFISVMAAHSSEVSFLPK